MEFLKKCMSRKFLTALAGILVGAAVMLGVEADEIKTAAGAVISAASLVSYILTEGKLDAAALQTKRKSAEGANGDDE